MSQTLTTMSSTDMLKVATPQELKLAEQRSDEYADKWVYHRDFKATIEESKKKCSIIEHQDESLCKSLTIPKGVHIRFKINRYIDSLFDLMLNEEDTRGRVLRFVLYERLAKNWDFETYEIDEGGILGSAKSFFWFRGSCGITGKWTWDEVFKFKMVLLDLIHPFYGNEYTLNMDVVVDK